METPGGERNPLISVLMPAFNADPYIAEAIGSILAQTHKNLELLIQDDGSADKTQSIVRAIAARDSRVRLLPAFPQNQGLIRARNSLLAHARGDFIAWQDADDVSAPDRLAHQLAFLEANPGYAAVGSGVSYFGVDGAPLGQETFPRDPERQATDPHLCCATLLVRSAMAERAGPFRTAFAPGGEDGDWVLRLADHGHVTNIDDILYGYRQHNSSSRRAVGAIRRLGVLARYAARVRRAGGPDPIDSIVPDAGFDYLADEVFLTLPGLTAAERLTALRYPLPSRQRLVSVLIPYFDAGAFFLDCLDRLARQSLRNFEVLVYDDGSAEPLDAMWAESVLADIPIKVVRGDINRGVVHARNALLADARGRFIAWQDADDYSAEDRLDRQVGHLLAHSEVNAIGTAINYVNMSVVARTERYRAHAFQSGTFRGCCATFMLRTEAARAVGSFDPRLGSAAEDIDFLRRIEPQSSVGNLDEPLYYYRRHGDRQLTGRSDWGIAQTYYELTRILHDHGLSSSNTEASDPGFHRSQIEAALRFRRRRLDMTDFAAMYVRIHLREIRLRQLSVLTLLPLTLRFPRTMMHSLRKFVTYRCGLMLRRAVGKSTPQVAPAWDQRLPTSPPPSTTRLPSNDAARSAGLTLVACWDSWGDFDDALRYLTPGGRGVWGKTAFVRDDGKGADWHAIFNGPGRPLQLTASPNRVIFAIGEPPTPNHRLLHYGQGRDTIVMTSDEIAAGQKSGERHFVMTPCMTRTWSVRRSYDELKAMVPEPKSKKLSWVTSNLALLPGHRRRLEFLERLRKQVQFDLYGRGFTPIPDKWDALSPYRYSIAFENTVAPYYFTEKLMDCFVAGTMPFYFGSPEITSFFPAEAMVLIDPDDPDVFRLIAEVAASDLWERRKDALAEAKRLTLDRYNIFGRISALVEGTDSMPGLLQNIIVEKIDVDFSDAVNG